MFGRAEGDLFTCNFISRLLLAVLTPPGNFPECLNCTLRWGMVLSSSTLKLAKAYLLFDSWLWQRLFLPTISAKWVIFQLDWAGSHTCVSFSICISFLSWRCQSRSSPGKTVIAEAKRCLTTGQESKGGLRRTWKLLAPHWHRQLDENNFISLHSLFSNEDVLMKQRRETQGQ